MFRYSDTVNGGQAVATAIINGEVRDLFYLKSLEAEIEKVKEEGKVLGNNATQNKPNGWKGTGTMTIYYVTSYFRNMLRDYKNTNKETYFTITVTNEDKGSTVGRQTTTLYDCSTDGGIIAKIDTDSAALDEEIAFTFQDWDMPEEFTDPIMS